MAIHRGEKPRQEALATSECSQEPPSIFLCVIRKKEKTDETHTDGHGAHLDAQMHAPETGREAKIRAGNGRSG
ncbi:MAG: hypothetical protein VYC68_01150, partial [Candidatus Thermoplasmatota archaeon]|nr:hypothetical protein [Candidatus Thermoplasmatota archaeon]